MKNILIIVLVVVFVGAVAYFKQSKSADTAQQVTNNTVTPEQVGGDVAEQTLPRLLDLGADKCSACKKMAPFLEELRKEYAGKAVIDFIDVLKDPTAEALFEVRIRPTQIFYDRNGEEYWRHEGFLSKDEIKAKFAELGVK